MTTRGLKRSLPAWLALMLAACGGSPASPSEPPVAIATGSQILRVSLTVPCGDVGGAGILFTRVDVTRSGAEWVARASGDGGNVELRVHQSGASVLAGSMPIAGTIAGTAVHMPALLPGAPIDSRIDFGGDGSATLSGVAFAPPLFAASGLSGSGSGRLRLADGAGGSCSAAGFTWGIGPAM